MSELDTLPSSMPGTLNGVGRQPLPDAEPPESYRLLAGEYPWLAMAAGAGIGMLIGALVPRGAGAKLARNAIGLAAVAGELGLAATARTREHADTLAREGLGRIRETGTDLRSRAERSAESAKSSGASLMRNVLELAVKVRK